jgi:acyl-CoA thioesterase-2
MVAADISELLELEEIDSALFRGPLSGAGHLFGGHVMAQAVRAAALTVGADRGLHSLHGYFLRRGDATRRVVYRVELDRDGGSFSSRRVIALQGGDPIFTVSTSFHVAEASGEYQIPMPVEGVAPPDSCEPDADHRAGPGEYFEVRWADGAPHGEEEIPARAWIRTHEPLPDDWTYHAAALAYVSDFGSGFGNVDVENLSQAGPSLDHVMWFHLPIRADDWVLLDMWPLRASGARGTYIGTIHDHHGTLGTTFAQEALLRTRS